MDIMFWIYPTICPRIGIWRACEEKIDTAFGKERQQIQGITMRYPIIKKLG